MIGNIKSTGNLVAVIQQGSATASIKPADTKTVVIGNKENIRTNMDSKGCLRASLLNAGGGVIAEEYDGEYTVIPMVIEQKMETKKKLMKDDVTIKAIPVFRTSNESGTTVFIGSEL